MIEEYLKKKITAKEVIVYGATIVACIENDIITNDSELQKIKNIKIIDVTPFSIGISRIG